MYLKSWLEKIPGNSQVSFAYIKEKKQNFA